MIELRSLTGHLSTLVLGSLVLSIVYSMSTAIYRVFFHPLSKFSGPRLAAASYLPSYYHQLKGDLIYWVYDLHKRYGPTVRYSPVRLSFADPQAIRDIYGLRAELKYCLPKDPVDYGVNGDSLLTYDNDAMHAKRRKIFNNAFSDRAIQAQEPLIQGYADMLIQLMDSKIVAAAGGPLAKVDMVDMYTFFNFDVVADMSFGEPLGVLREGRYTTWVEALLGAAKLTNTMNVLNQFVTLRFLMQRVLPLLMPESIKKKGEDNWNFATQAVDTRLARQTARADLWTYILRETKRDVATILRDTRHAKDKQLDDLTLHEMHTNATLMMMAGTETTSGLLACVTYLLLKDPGRMRRLQIQVRERFTSSKEMTFAALTKLSYLNDCLHEALRLYPPLPQSPQRVIPNLPGGGMTIACNFVPTGTGVSAHGYTISRLAENFKSPFSFIPERWSDTTGEFNSDNKSAVQPFIVGPRNCIGQTLAMHEARLALAKVLWHFDLSLDEETGDWLDQKAFVIWEKKPLMVYLKRGPT